VTREVIFRNDAGTMTVTLCTFQAKALPLTPCPTHRLIRVLAGTLTLAEPALAPQVLGPDAHVFLPKGTEVAWAFSEASRAVIVDVDAP
ncbi:MAG: hypothetical protein ACKO2N_09165, partial [Tabrizicola sp.]